MGRRAGTGLALLVAALAACGCSALVDPVQEAPVRSYDDLTARIRLDEAVARYEQMQQRIRDQLDAELGPFAWRQVFDASPRHCGPDFPPDYGGRILGLAAWGFDAPVGDADWPRARDIVAAVAAEYGFASAGVQVDEPGRHVTGGVDAELGASYGFSTQVNTTLRVTTGCHLPTAP
jgi:hypothetical protein